MVASGLARRCEIQLGYAIGIANPVSLMLETFGTGKLPDEQLADVLLRHTELTPSAIIETLCLREPIYHSTSAYGHFGAFAKRQTWESEDIAQSLLFRVQDILKSA